MPRYSPSHDDVALLALEGFFADNGVPLAAPAPPPASPAEFATRVLGAKWHNPPHIRLINGLLVDAASGRLRSGGHIGVIVQLPPRHGKSTLCSEWFPAWYLGAHPDKRIILTSYEADFAASWGRKARNLLAEHGKSVFKVELNPEVAAASRWETMMGGGMVTAGVGGAITGRGADVLIVDDPVKNAEEAASTTIRNATWEWYMSTARTRLEPGGVIVVIMTRWHPDDLAGRLIAAMNDDDRADKFQVVKLPALAVGDNDPLGRQEGEALWPDRYPASVLTALQTDTARRVWLALYQQEPVDAPAGTPVYDATRLVEKRLEYRPELRLFGGLDFGYACPFCQIAQIEPRQSEDGKGTKEVLRFLWEVTKFNSNVTDFARAVFDELERLFPREAINSIEWRGDIAGNQKSDKSNETSIEMFQAVARERGYRCFIQTMSQPVEWGINLLQEKISAGEVEVNEASCYYLKKGLRGSYVRDSRGEPVGGVEGHPYTDAMDAARYMVAGLFGVRRGGEAVTARSEGLVTPTQASADAVRGFSRRAIQGCGGRIPATVSATGVWRPKRLGDE